MKKLVVVLIAAFAATFVTTGCNTIAGMGKDIEAAGGAVEKSASDTKKKM